MSKKQWELIGSPTLKETLIIPTNFDGSKIATLVETLVLMVIISHRVLLLCNLIKNVLIGGDIINLEQRKLETFLVLNTLKPTLH